MIRRVTPMLALLALTASGWAAAADLTSGLQVGESRAVQRQGHHRAE